MSYSLNDFLSESEKQIHFYDRQISEYEALIEKTGQQTSHLESQRMDVLLRMVDVIAPDFSLADLEKIAKLIHNARLPQLFKEQEAEREKLQKRLAAIDADPEYIKADHLIDERTGEYTRELAQIGAAFDKERAEFEPFEPYHAEFEDLIKDKYGTPEYEHKGIFRFFNNEHLENWKVGDILCEQFGYESFLPLREKYESLIQSLKELGEAVYHYQSKIKYIKDMIAERQNIEERLPLLPSEYKKRLSMELDMFLNSTSQESKAAFFNAYPQLDDLAKTQQGLNFQRQYLDDFKVKLDTEKGQVFEKKAKLYTERRRYEVNPYKYQNKVFDRDKFQKRFQRNEGVVSSRFAKYHKTNETIYNFNDYHSAPSVLSNIFWWDVITNNKIDGSFSPSVTDYYNSHTHDSHSYEREPVVNDDITNDAS